MSLPLSYAARSGTASPDAAAIPRSRRAFPAFPRPSLLLAAAFLAFLLLSCLAPHLVSGGDPFHFAPRHAFAAPSFAHPFGTDQSGRDILACVVFGTRQSLLIGAGATAVAMAIAITLTLLGGLGGRWAEAAMQWLFQVLFSFPVLMLALLFSAAFGHGIGPLVLATGLAGAAGYGRMVLSQVRTVRDASYVEAARVLGHHPLGIIRRHVLPNAMRSLVVVATMGVGQNIVWSAALSFLGLGAPPPTPEWGTMLAMGRDFIANAWWLTVFPGAFVVLTSLTTTALGHALQRRLETRPA